MQRLKKIGAVQPKSAAQIKTSRLGIGFEKLDRALFDPNKAYDKLAAIGVKWVRIQSGWKRTEKEIGIYDFDWLDEIVDNLLARGLVPWIDLAWGNDLYTTFAARFFGAVGCPPVDTEEERRGWSNYCTALAAHFKGRVEYFEVWNEPDLRYGWRHKETVVGTKGTPNATEYAAFTIATSKALKAGNADAKVIGFALAHPKASISYLSEAAKAGIFEHIDAASYHLYSTDFANRVRYAKNFTDTVHHYAPGLPIIQGESGTQSRFSEAGALREMNWDEQKQAKFLLRQIICDLASDVLFTSYFSTMDMAEALNGIVGQAQSFHDYGYFGVLAAEFDENGVASGEYHEKPSYFALQTMASLLFGDVKVNSFPYIFNAEECRFVNGSDRYDEKTAHHCFTLDDGSHLLAYWQNTKLLEETFDGVTTVELLHSGNIELIDPMDGSIYALPESMVERNGTALTLKHVPLKDYPLLLHY